MRYYLSAFIGLLLAASLATATSVPFSTPPAEPNRLTLQEIRVDPGGEIEKTVLRLIALDPGSPIDPDILIQTREELEASRVLRDVELYTSRGDRPGAVILHVAAEPERRLHVETGLGREPMHGWYLNIIGARFTNPFNRGGHVRLGFREFLRDGGFYLEAEYPRLFGNDFDLLLQNEFEIERWQVNDGDNLLYQEIRRMNVDIGLRRWSRRAMSAALWIGFSSAEPDEVLVNDAEDYSEPAGRLLPDPGEMEDFLNVRLDLAWDRMDMTRPWQKGHWSGLRLKASETVDGAPFWGAELESRRTFPIGRIHALGVRTRGAYAGGGTPYHLRPVVGGIGSLRGFTPAGLSGPLGARGFWQLNTEWRMVLVGDNPRKPRVIGTAFVDVGDHWGGGGGRYGISAGAGYGLLFRIPWIQILNAEVAYPLTRNETGDAVTLYMSLGRSF